MHARYRVHTKLSSIFTLLTGASEHHSSKDFAGIDLHPPPFLFTPHWAIPKQWRENYNLGARFHTHTLSLPRKWKTADRPYAFERHAKAGGRQSCVRVAPPSLASVTVYRNILCRSNSCIITVYTRAHSPFRRNARLG